MPRAGLAVAAAVFVVDQAAKWLVTGPLGVDFLHLRSTNSSANLLLRLLEPFGIVLVDYKVLDTFDAEVGEGSSTIPEPVQASGIEIGVASRRTAHVPAGIRLAVTSTGERIES